MANDSTLANMLYGNQVNTSKNLVAARSIRHSLRDSMSLTDEKGVAGPLGENSTVHLPLMKEAANFRMNRTSALSGFQDIGNGPVKVNQAFATASSKFNI